MSYSRLKNRFQDLEVDELGDPTTTQPGRKAIKKLREIEALHLFSFKTPIIYLQIMINNMTSFHYKLLIFPFYLHMINYLYFLEYLY